MFYLDSCSCMNYLTVSYNSLNREVIDETSIIHVFLSICKH